MGSIKCVEVGAENTGIAGTAATALPAVATRRFACGLRFAASAGSTRNGNSIPDA
jgi:hypothetical protein